MANRPRDVEVVLSREKRYKFHADTLARNSTLLASMLTEKTAAKLGNKARSHGITTRWMIELVDLRSENTPAGSLELVELNHMGRPCDPREGRGMVINENGRLPEKLFDYYEQIFQSFYTPMSVLSHLNDDDMATVLIDAIEFIQVAEYLGSMPAVSKPVDVALTKHGQSLFRAIQNKPCLWIELAVRIKSEVIFKEAVIHLAGNWRKIKADREAMRTLRECGVSAVCEKYHRILSNKGKKLELAIVSLYPGGIATPHTELPIKREYYAKDVLIWMALTFFRHWFAQRIVSDQGSKAADGGYGFYVAMSKAGDAYMDKPVMTQFHKKFPLTKKAMNVVENHLLELKECIKGTVESHGILESKCQLDTHRFPVDYLTCVEVVKEDVVWTEDDVTVGMGQPEYEENMEVDSSDGDEDEEGEEIYRSRGKRRRYD